MKILLDKYGYFTGNYATLGDIEGSIEIPELPPYDDLEKQLSCKWVENRWFYDITRYRKIQKQNRKEEVEREISQLQAKLNESDYKIIKANEYKLLDLEIPYDIKELHKERQNIRDKINELREEIK